MTYDCVIECVGDTIDAAAVFGVLFEGSHIVRGRGDYGGFV
jgi:hypothetical protein